MGNPTPEKLTRNQKIYILKMAGRTLASIGKKFNLTRQRVQQIFIREIRRRERL